MEARLLRYSDSKLSPEARWLLLQWSRDPGLSEPFTCRRLELYRHLGIAHQHARPALKELTERGFLIDEPLRPRRGRPTSRTRVSPKFLSLLDTLDATQSKHRPEIESLCQKSASGSQESFPQSPINSGRRTNKLTPANCLLLAVLLNYAEAPGIVTGMSLRQLATVTGMTKERVRTQLAKLKTLGIIVGGEPGIRRNRGAINIRSVYELELTHPLLMGENSVVAAYSRPRLPLIPDEACHPFHAKAATDSTAKLPPRQVA